MSNAAAWLVFDEALARRVGTHQIAQPFARLHVDSVFVGAELALAVFELAPQPVQMGRMLHMGSTARLVTASTAAAVIGLKQISIRPWRS